MKDFFDWIYWGILPFETMNEKVAFLIGILFGLTVSFIILGMCLLGIGV